jgi:copper chaperone CopZ
MKKTVVFLAFLFLTQSSLTQEKQKASIPVKGMHCASCVSMIKKTVRKVPGVENVSVNLDSAKVELEYNSAQALPEAIKAITRMGYKVEDSDSTAQEEIKLKN